MKEPNSLTRDDLLLLLRLVAQLEATYLMQNDPESAMRSMQDGIRRTLGELGRDTSTQEVVQTQVNRLGVHIRQALGEAVDDDGNALS